MAKEKVLTQEELTLSNGYKVKIAPVKLQHFVNRDFLFYKLVLETGVLGTFEYRDGDIIFKRLLSAILNKPYETKQTKNEETETFETEYTFSEEVETIMSECTLADLDTIINKSLEVTGIDPNDKKTMTETTTD